ncbi:MAG: HNH endonuclease [Saprospiraceae bacterium]
MNTRIHHCSTSLENYYLCLEHRVAGFSNRGHLYCEACGFNFQTVYGQDFIECHHKFPIAASGPRTNTLEDLALVCSNCHRMLHRKIDGQYLSVKALKALIVLSQKKLS